MLQLLSTQSLTSQSHMNGGASHLTVGAHLSGLTVKQHASTTGSVTAADNNNTPPVHHSSAVASSSSAITVLQPSVHSLDVNVDLTLMEEPVGV